jgi:hypothetical protein
VLRLRTRPRDTDLPPAVLLGGEAIAVSAARSLGAGVRVYALGDAKFDAVAHCRYCDTFVDLGSGEGVQERWLEWLQKEGPRGAVILPCNDDGLEMIARNRQLLTDLGSPPQRRTTRSS